MNLYNQSLDKAKYFAILLSIRQYHCHRHLVTIQNSLHQNLPPNIFRKAFPSRSKNFFQSVNRLKSLRFLNTMTQVPTAGIISKNTHLSYM